MDSFRFIPLEEKDFELLHVWLNRPHIAEIWVEDSPMTFANVAEKYRKHLKSISVFPHIVYLNNNPIGFIQSYNCKLVGDGWWESEPKGTWGMDQYIGEAQLLNKGIGSAFIRQFSDQLLQRSDINRVIVDPNPTNLRAIKSYEKAGFSKKGLTMTPDGESFILEKFKL